MATTKITVMMPAEMAADIRDRVAAGEAESVSAYITRAVQATRDLDPLDRLIASTVAETARNVHPGRSRQSTPGPAAPSSGQPLTMRRLIRTDEAAADPG